MQEINFIDSFIADPNQNDLYNKLLKERVCDEKEAEAIIHALVDIGTSVKRIYHEIIPEIKNQQLSGKALKEKLWDIREEIRHIEYHIKDGRLAEL